MGGSFNFALRLTEVLNAEVSLCYRATFFAFFFVCVFTDIWETFVIIVLRSWKNISWVFPTICKMTLWTLNQTHKMNMFYGWKSTRVLVHLVHISCHHQITQLFVFLEQLYLYSQPACSQIFTSVITKMICSFE